ncbi:MAG TPA: c-type cytochrome [Thermodesulfobacteriota bacterium]
MPAVLLVTAAWVAGGCGARPVPGGAGSPAAAPPGLALLDRHCTTCHALDRTLAAGGTEDEWAATVARHVSRYAVGEVTGLTDADRSTIVSYLAAVRPPDPARRPLRASAVVLRPSASPPQSGGPGPREPRTEPSAAADAQPGAAERMPAGPDPVLGEGRPGKPLAALDSRVRDAVERGAERWEAEGCPACHRSDVEVRAWWGAFPQVPLFRPEAGVVSFEQAVAYWRRRSGGPVTGAGPAPGNDDLVSYLAWRADGAPMAPGRAYPLPPAEDLERLEAVVARGRVVADGAPGRADRGACGGCHGAGGAGGSAPEIVGSAALFPRFVPELGRVATLEEFLTGHLATVDREDPLGAPRLGPPASPDSVAVGAYLAWLARDRLVDMGRPPGARTRGSAELGREIFELRCAICHDPRGRGPGPLGPGLAGLFERPRAGGPREPEAVVRTIRAGARGMPAFFDLTAAQIEDLLAYLRTL